MATYTFALSDPNRSTDVQITSPQYSYLSTLAAMAKPSSSTALAPSWQSWCRLWGSEIVATGILIFLLDLLLRIPSKLRKSRRSENWSNTIAAVVTNLALVLDSAIEYPLFFAFHPVTLSSASSIRSTYLLPSTAQLGFQVATLYFVEYTFGHFVLRRISFPSGDTAPPAAGTEKPHLDNESNTDEAARLARDFLQPRGALLLAMAFPATLSPFVKYCGPFHPLSMIFWAASRQLFFKSDDESA